MSEFFRNIPSPSMLFMREARDFAAPNVASWWLALFYLALFPQFVTPAAGSQPGAGGLPVGDAAGDDLLADPVHVDAAPPRA